MNGRAESALILGGGVMEVGELLLEPVGRWAGYYVFEAAYTRTRIVRSTVSKESGVQGAATPFLYQRDCGCPRRSVGFGMLMVRMAWRLLTGGENRAILLHAILTRRSFPWRRLSRRRPGSFGAAQMFRSCRGVRAFNQ